jgi:2C-methyl-D-erythritol 2,4-cyclodiphosphate synthase
MSDAITSILFTGDFCPHLRTEQLCREKNYDAIFNDMTEILRDADFSITNLECPLTVSNEKIEKVGPHLKADCQSIEALKHIHCDAVTLANNHILDYGQKGLMETINVCQSNSILFLGAGINTEQAAQPLIVKLNETEFVFLNYCENEFSIALNGKPGANELLTSSVYRDIMKYKTCENVVAIIIHGGNEHYRLPNPRIVDKYRLFAEFGADLIVCHHSHCYSGYEIYDGTPIFYSLGNFIFDWKNEPNSLFNTGIAVKILFKNRNFDSFKIIPFKQYFNEKGVKQLTDKEKTVFDESLKYLLEVINSKEKLEKEWNSFCNEKIKYYYSTLFNYGKFYKLLMRMGITPNSLVKKGRKLRLLDMFRCDAHRKVIEHILEY